jgi:hypothetical protein
LIIFVRKPVFLPDDLLEYLIFLMFSNIQTLNTRFMRNCLLILCAIAGIMMITSCEEVVFKPAPVAVSFGEYVIPLVKDKCFDCHEGQTPAHTTWGDSATLYAVFLQEQVIDTANLPDGKLYQALKSGTSTHVQGFLTSAELDTLTRWVDEGTREYNTPAPVSFILEIAPMIVSKCTACHNNWKPAGSLYETWVTTGRLNPDNVTSSPLYSIISDAQSHAPLNTAQRELVLRWLNQGAKNN